MVSARAMQAAQCNTRAVDRGLCGELGCGGGSGEGRLLGDGFKTGVMDKPRG